MMFASGWVASSPSSARASGNTWSALRFSGKCERILPAKEMSFNSYSIPELAVKARTIGRSEWVARAGASSVWVYAIFEVDIVFLSTNPFEKLQSSFTRCNFFKTKKHLPENKFCLDQVSERIVRWESSMPEIPIVNSEISLFPVWVLALSVFWVVISIAKWKLHPFLALISAAIFVGLLSGPLPEKTIENTGLFERRVNLNETDANHSNLTLAVKWSLLGFGNTAGGIGLIIALAAIVGTCMMKSGAAERIVRHLLAVFGEKRAGLVLLLSGFLLSIPVFFDTVFFLLIPLARAMAIRVGGRYLYFVMAMAGAGAITHSMVPPTPGPLMIATLLKIEFGNAMVAGLLVSLPLAALVLWVCRQFENKYSFPMRDVGGIKNSELEKTLSKNLSELPSVVFSYLPILLPVVLITLVSLLKLLEELGVNLVFLRATLDNGIFRILSFFGDPNIAMSIAALVSVLLLVNQEKKKHPNPNEFFHFCVKPGINSCPSS